MNDDDLKIDDEVDEHQSINNLEKAFKSQSPMLGFFTDFLTGFGVLFLIGAILFIAVPLLLFTLKIGVALAVPIAFLGACIILIALFGRLVKFLIKRKDKR